MDDNYLDKIIELSKENGVLKKENEYLKEKIEFLTSEVERLKKRSPLPSLLARQNDIKEEKEKLKKQLKNNLDNNLMTEDELDKLANKLQSIFRNS